MRRATQDQLAFISKLESARLNDLKSGEGLAAKTGYAVQELIGKATSDRMRLARACHQQATEASASKCAPNRLTISRAYYAMYHCLRAVVFFVNGGDEFEKHAELPRHLPRDFPSVATWENELKHARLQRNRVDYEPFPRSDDAYATSAVDLLTKSADLLNLADAYLRRKGLRV
jgi:uncharacterized protein (UPF0332 family)